MSSGRPGCWRDALLPILRSTPEPDFDRSITLGVSLPGRPPAALVTDNATLMRLFAGRPATG